MTMVTCREFRRSIATICFIVPIMSLHATQSWPVCQDHNVIFISQPRDVGITCRQDKVAMFPCQYTGSNTHPHWMINSTFYSSLDLYLPPDLSYEDNILTVTNLRSKNGSTYQCVLFSSEGCMYKSTVGQLKCEDIEVQCLPHYHYANATLNDLMGINTIITQGDNTERIYNVTYMNSDSGDRCDSVNLTCNDDGDCQHMFRTATSNCSYMSNVTVIVSAIADTINPMPDPIRIDGTNNFVRVFITPASFSCMFINQPEESEKFCEIEYGPTTPECKNLTFDSKLYFTSDSSNIEIPLDSPADSNICFIVIAGNGTKNVTIEGKSSGASINRCYISESTLTALILCNAYFFSLLNIIG